MMEDSREWCTFWLMEALRRSRFDVAGNQPLEAINALPAEYRSDQSMSNGDIRYVQTPLEAIQSVEEELCMHAHSKALECYY